MGEHEKYAARVFGAHRTYCVTNGTSMSNRVIFMAAVARDQIALCDRNCHKSIEHSLVMTGGIPNYLVPLRNRYGIIGPIPPARLEQGGDQGRDQGQSAGDEGRSTRGAVLLGRHELHVRRPVLQRAARRGAARPERRPHPFRRSLVRVRALQSALSRSPRDARRSRRITRVRRSSPRIPRTSCWRRCRRRRSCTSATAAARFRIRASTSRS